MADRCGAIAEEQPEGCDYWQRKEMASRSVQTESSLFVQLDLLQLGWYPAPMYVIEELCPKICMHYLTPLHLQAKIFSLL